MKCKQKKPVPAQISPRSKISRRNGRRTVAISGATLQRLIQMVDQLVRRLQKALRSQNQMKSEKAKLEAATAELEREIAERKLAEEWRRRHEASFRSMIESVKEQAIVLLDHEGRIVSWNRGAELMTGYATEEILGKHFFCFDPAEDGAADAAQEMLDAALTAGQWTGEGWRLRKDGSRFWASIVVTAVRDAADALLGFTNVMGDLTQRREAELAIQRAKEEAESANQAKSDFLANVSHEVRTPMTGIIGMAGLLAETELSPKQREYCEIIRRSSESLLTIINEILDFSKAESGKMELEIIDFDLRTAVEEVSGLFSSQAAEKGLELISFVRYDVPTLLKGDPGRLRQVLSNLISNALKFTATGEVVLRVKVVEQNTAVATLRFEVSDTGIGIPKNGIEDLFDPFTQADPSTTRKYGGTGLGLAICKKFVALMGGEIGVDSEVGKGSTFWFTLPFLRQRNSAPKPLNPRHDFIGMRALVVESSPTHSEVLEHYLEALGFECACTENSADALQLLREGVSAGRRYHLVIMDAKLLAMDGVVLAHTIKHDPMTGAPKLMLLTSLGQRGDGKLAEEAGFAAYLTKPVSFACLTECLAFIADEGSSSDGFTPLVTRHRVAELKAQTRIRVLVADDNHINQKVVASLLENMGHRADVVASGIEALEAFILVPYDVVLLDLQMAEIDGIEACRRIRKLAKETGRHTWVVAVTAHAMKGDREKYLAAGFDGYVSKPIDPQELKAVIDLRSAGELPISGDRLPETAPAILDLSSALARVEDNDELLAKVGRAFIELYPKLLDQCQSAIGRADCAQLARAARTIASSAGQLGAARVRAVAKKLEQLSRQDSLADAHAVLEELDLEIRLLEPGILDGSSGIFPKLHDDP
jgi:two-component system sensor histidine kinase/response regulator